MIRKIVLISIGIASCFASNPALAADTNLCVARGYTVVFFNGVFNTPDDAARGMAFLRAYGSDTFNGEPVVYEVSYNYSGTNAGAGIGNYWQDLAETFEQRANAIDTTGNLAKHWELLWESVGSGGSFTNTVVQFFSGSSTLIEGLRSDLRAKMLGIISSITANPPTESQYAAANGRLTDLALQRQKLLLVAHSQGNLFLNRAFDFIKPQIGASSVAALQIAPASSTTKGAYFLSSSDVVINGLRAVNIGSVPAANLTMPIYADDFSGHQLIPTYLNPGKEAHTPIFSEFKAALGRLQTPSLTGSTGAFTVTLTWDGTGDVDLHVTEPAGAHVYYSSRQGAVGALDYDNTTSFGPEHYYATCDSTRMQTGTYKIGINNYSGATGRRATVQVSSTLNGLSRTKSNLDVGAVRGSAGNSSPIPVFQVIVGKDTTGKFTYEVQ